MKHAQGRATRSKKGGPVRGSAGRRYGDGGSVAAPAGIPRAVFGARRRVGPGARVRIVEGDRLSPSAGPHAPRLRASGSGDAALTWGNQVIHPRRAAERAL